MSGNFNFPTVVPAADGFYTLEFNQSNNLIKLPIVGFLIGACEYTIPVNIGGLANICSSILTPCGVVYDHNLKVWPDIDAWKAQFITEVK